MLSPQNTAAAHRSAQASPRTLYIVFGLTFDKLLIVAVIAAFLIGPERLPAYAAKLGQLTRSLRDFANGAKTRMREEMGPEFDEVDWKKLDPRQYDPRRIIREALLDDPDTAAVSSIKPVTGSAYEQRSRQLQPGSVPPFDGEST